MYPVAAVLAGLGAVTFIIWDRHTTCVALVEGALKRYHATDIRVRNDWLDFDSDNFTYDVKWRDQSGTQRVNRCKIRATAPLDDAIFWDQPIE